MSKNFRKGFVFFVPLTLRISGVPSADVKKMRFFLIEKYYLIFRGAASGSANDGVKTIK